MKTCMKACLIGTIAFISLSIVTLIIGYSIMKQQGQFASEHHEPLMGKYHNPDAEGMINRMNNIKKNFDNSRLHDLDDHEQRKFLETNGLIVTAGQSAMFKAVENPSTGYKWQIDQESCKQYVHISSEYIPPPEK